MEPLRDEAAYSYADNFDSWSDACRQWRLRRRLARRRFYVETVGMIIGAILLILVGSAFGDPCGKERWDAKTHTDGALPVQQSTVERLRAVPTLPRAALSKVKGRLPSELKLYTLDALLIGFKKEADSDFHLVIASPKNKKLTMIAEAISPDCTDDGKLAAESATVRKYIEDNFGRVTAKFSRLRTPVEVTITGMFFLDFIHGQTGVAGNGCELHPLTAIQIADGSVTVVKPKSTPTATPYLERLR